MKALILTCNTGGGHNTTANAISEYFTAQGVECVTMDCLDFLSPAKAKLISEGHVLLYRKAPKLFGLGYRFEENHIPKFLVNQCEACADEFYEAVQQVGCDLVINVHVFPALIMTAAVAQYGLKLPGYFVATDYTCSPGTACSKLDAYFIPHESLRQEFMDCGVPGDKLVPTGIPVGAACYRSVPQAEARERLGLPAAGKVVLLACGSMGAGPMEELAQLLDRSMSAEDHLVVICGTNEKLLEKLQKDRLSHCVTLLGFTKDMPLYMDAADLMLTKAAWPHHHGGCHEASAPGLCGRHPRPGDSEHRVYGQPRLRPHRRYAGGADRPGLPSAPGPVPAGRLASDHGQGLPGPGRGKDLRVHHKIKCRTDLAAVDCTRKSLRIGPVGRQACAAAEVSSSQKCHGGTHRSRPTVYPVIVIAA